MRLPKPVLMKPREIKNATTMSQMVLFPKPLSAWLIVSVLVSAVASIPNKAIAGMGNGFVIIPTMVATKIANKCQARGWTPDGGGISQMTTASKSTATNTPTCLNLAPGCGAFDLTPATPFEGRDFPLVFWSILPLRKEGPIILPVTQKQAGQRHQLLSGQGMS